MFVFPRCLAAIAVFAGLLAPPTVRGQSTAPTSRPYVDPTQLDVPFPKHDPFKIPWRAWLETRAGDDFVRGNGMVYNADNDELAVRLLAECGYKTFRMEIGFDSLAWDEQSLVSGPRWLKVLKLCRQYGIRPTILLNAHHGAPGPRKVTRRTLAVAAHKGDTQVQLTDTTDLVVGESGLDNLSEFWAAEALFTAIDPATGLCHLSKPLPKDLPVDKPIEVSVLKFKPFYPVGTKEFDQTTDGWLVFVDQVCRLLKDAGIDQYDLEIWNELTFGSNFLNINKYYQQPLFDKQPPSLHKGGIAWELARRTVDHVKQNVPQARVLWGFSNITFFETSIDQLPPGIDGQSYHPYGTGTRSLRDEEQYKGQPGNREGPPPPDFLVRLPEGTASVFIQTESIMRLLEPSRRLAIKPKGTARFYHYITEHGVFPAECDVKDQAAAWRMKSKSVLRAPALWLNKGLDVMHWFCAFSTKWENFGVLPTNLKSLPVDAKFDDVATPPMKAMRNFSRCFAASVPLERTTPLQVKIAEIGPPRKIFDSADGAATLWERDVLAVLPFQLDAEHFAIPVYVMTYDVTQDYPGSRYRLTLENLPAGANRARYYDPITDQWIDVKPEMNNGVMSVELPMMDYPRVLLVNK